MELNQPVPLKQALEEHVTDELLDQIVDTAVGTIEFTLTEKPLNEHIVCVSVITGEFSPYYIEMDLLDKDRESLVNKEKTCDEACELIDCIGEFLENESNTNLQSQHYRELIAKVTPSIGKP